MKKIKVTLNEMEAKIYELCKLATQGSDNGAMFCFNEVAVPAKKQYGLSQDEVKGYLGSLKKKDVLRKMSDSYYDFTVVELVEDDFDWCYLDELYKVEITVKGAETPAPSTTEEGTVVTTAKKFKIYQLPIRHNAKFMRYDFVKKHNIVPELTDYKMVGEGKMFPTAGATTEGLLNSIYETLNTCRPDWFNGHSLSVSDVVELDGKFYYCDSCGWKELDWNSHAKKNTYKVLATNKFGEDYALWVEAEDENEAQDKVYALGAYKNVVQVVQW